MVKKIVLFSLLCTVTAQADWQEDIAPRDAYAATKLIVASAGSYTLYSILSMVIEKLEKDHKISPATAKRLKMYIKVKALVLPAFTLLQIYNNPLKLKSFDDFLRITQHTFNSNTGLLSAELTAWNTISKLIF